MSAWSGQPGGPRYCHRKPCQRAGREAGHIVARKRKHSAPTSDSDLADHENRSNLPAGLDLLELDEVCEMRFISPAHLTRAPQRWNPVANKNKKLELLVYGKYSLGEEDENGRMAYYWLTKSAMLEMGFDEADVAEAVEAHLAEMKVMFEEQE